MSEFDQSNLDLSTETPCGPVECLGQTFESDDARREHYTDLLREKLKDPEFRKIEGFPIGEDEDILALSDPPYYTACPNPWIEDFVKHHGRPYDPDEKYHREPFAADVSEGKGHAIYNAHSYHTKVPHRAIMRYILHYTEPGDVVFDGFCGTGMTGVAAQLCGDEAEVQELGYRIDQEGKIYNESDQQISRIGPRKAMLSDLSSAASFITYNYNTPIEASDFSEEANNILKEVENETGWMYETFHNDGKIGKINYVVWSDVFGCPECLEEFAFYNEAIGIGAKKVHKIFKCPNCHAELTKRSANRIYSSILDKDLNETIKQLKQVPVVINYTLDGIRYDKTPDSSDLSLIDKINNEKPLYWYPTDRMIDGHESRRNDKTGLTHVHHYYTVRNRAILAALWGKTKSKFLRRSSIVWSASNIHLNKMRRWQPVKPGGTPGLSGTLYVGSTPVELSPFDGVPRKIRDIAKSFRMIQKRLSVTETCSAFAEHRPLESVDYIFTDPPFGSNLNYSELNFNSESWLKVKTNNKSEAIENKVQGKDLNKYRMLMMESFKTYHKLLKPGRWMTVEFSNTNSSVWNSIQSALSETGFIIANVSALDKQHGTFKAITTTTAVKQDLVISAYKPSKQLELIFSENGDSVEGVWQFIDSHLKQLPVSKPKGGSLEFVAERDPRILYDRMVAFYIGHNTPVPLSSGEFQAALDDKYPDRDGMVFLPEQVAHYDKLAAKMESVGQMVVFVEDEKSAIGWLRQYLKDKPSTYQGIHPDFTQQLSASWRKFESRPELSVLLDQNFLKYSGEGDVPSQIHGYLSTDYHGLRKLEKDDPKLKAKAKDRWYVPDPKKMRTLRLSVKRNCWQSFGNMLHRRALIVGKLKHLRPIFLSVSQPRRNRR